MEAESRCSRFRTLPTKRRSKTNLEGDSCIVAIDKSNTTFTVQAPVLRISATFHSIVHQANGTYLVTISLKNTGNITATNVTAAGTLRTSTSLKLDSSVIAVTNLAPGATGTLTLVFPANTGRSGTRNVTFRAIGIATGANPNASAATPALWAVSKTGLTRP
jgi:uncharacterized repeat protein (TIGR01451 family)